ncbi:hypothetical protein [Arthrobacter sp. STN4]|uniref:hypothetical protein n=1 Tax=Arthrobacter sp. STN4 TaxID=2923276 RepID=UPI00211A2CFD|nr:hypothetical protein [Arthrobacter sp. STN4]MCQ9162937.1 hypothetical protein [Arthrobacter sp. STN4]
MPSDAPEHSPVTPIRSPTGDPVSVVIAGRTWTVVGEPVRWFERRERWWEHTPRLPWGTGAGVIDRAVIRVEARLGRNPRSATQTFELVAEADGAWAVRDVLRAA